MPPQLTEIEKLAQEISNLTYWVKSIQWELKNLHESNTKNTNKLITALDCFTDSKKEENK